MINTQFKSELEQIYDYYKQISKTLPVGNNVEFDKNGNRIVLHELMFGFLIGFYGMNKKPQIVSNDSFDKLGRSQIYRGYKEYDHCANALSHYDYHFGTGMIHGMYFAQSREIAARYTRSGIGDQVDYQKVLKAKIDSDKFMNFEELIKLKLSPLHDLPYGTKKEHKRKMEEFSEFARKILAEDRDTATSFIHIMKMPSLFAVYLGLDYLKQKRMGYNIVYNRETITTTVDEFERFCENSKHYKTGVYDFHDCASNTEDEKF